MPPAMGTVGGGSPPRPSANGECETECCVLWVLAILIAVAGLALALLLPDINWADRLRFGAVAIVVLCALLLLAYTLRQRLAQWATVLLNSRGERYFPALWAVSPLVPTAAMVATALTFLAWKDDYALLIGSGSAVAGWLAGGIIGIRYVAFETANVTTFGEFMSRVCMLQRRTQSLKDDMTAEPKDTGETQTNSKKQADPNPKFISEAVYEAERQLHAICLLKKKKGFLWIRGQGYNNLWIILHAAEEALLKARRREAVVGEGLYDESRLHDSKIDHREELLARLRNAISSLNPSATQLFFAPFNRPHKPTDSDSDNTSETWRETISEIRREINAFNDSNYEGIVRTRNTILSIVPFAGLMGLVAEDAAILSGAEQKHIVAFLGFFVAGSFAGLASWVLTDLTKEMSIQDFGLATARLFRTIAFSGLTAAAGVYVLAALLGAVGLNPVVSDVLDNSAATPPASAMVQTRREDSREGTPTGEDGSTAGRGGDLAEGNKAQTLTGGTSGAVPNSLSEPPQSGAMGAGARTTVALDNPRYREVLPGRQEVTPTASDPDTACDDDDVWPLRCVYDLDENPFGLIVAMILGLTPELLLNTLKLQGDRYFEHLKSTQPGQGG